MAVGAGLAAAPSHLVVCAGVPLLPVPGLREMVEAETMTSPYEQLLEAGRKARQAQQAQQEASKAVAAEIAAQRPPPPPPAAPAGA